MRPLSSAPRAIRFAQTIIELDAVGQDDEERHPVPAVGLLGTDDQGFGHLGDAVDDVVDVGTAQAHALPVEGGVRAAGDDDAAVVGDGDPVAVAPDSGEHREVRVAVALTVGIVPELHRHRRHRGGDDHLPDLADQRLPRVIPGLQRHTEHRPRELASPDRTVRRGSGEAADDVRAAARRGQLHALADSIAHPWEAVGGHWCTGGTDRPQRRQVELRRRVSIPAFIPARKIPGLTPSTFTFVSAAISHSRPGPG